MKRIITRIIPLLAVSLLGTGMFNQQSHAALIVGEVAFENGDAILNNTIATATAVTGYSGTISVNPNAIVTNGDYPTTGDSAVNFAPFTFSPSLSPNPVSPMWTFTSGLDTYFFDLTSVSIAFQGTVAGTSYLDLAGKGMLYIQLTSNGSNIFSPTNGNFAFDIQSASGNAQDTFEFTASNAALPDGGWTVALLGMSLGGIEVLRRKMAGARNNMIA
jgi:hypothetical protein